MTCSPFASVRVPPVNPRRRLALARDEPPHRLRELAEPAGRTLAARRPDPVAHRVRLRRERLEVLAESVILPKPPRAHHELRRERPRVPRVRLVRLRLRV